MKDHEKKPHKDTTPIEDVPVQTTVIGDTPNEDDSGNHVPTPPPTPPGK